MKNLYTKIWVSLYYRIKYAQNDNQNVALIMSILVLTITNIINYYLLCYLLITFFKVNINIVNILNFQNRGISIIFTTLLFLLPNYAIFIFNKKYISLIEDYKHVNRNIGLYYFIVSCVLIVSLIFAMIASPELFGLQKPTGMNGALHLLEIPLEGIHHRGVDDAKNIAKILNWCLAQ